MQSRPSAEVLSNIAEIYTERASFELNEDEIHVLRRHFNSVTSLRDPPQAQASELQEREREFEKWKAKHPSLLDRFEQFEQQAKGKCVTLFLDYDGTLAPIVKDPDRAFMPDQMRAAVRQIARLVPTAIISGRGREKVAGFVGLKELFYAGSHGLDIVGPQVNGKQGLAFQPAAHFAPVMDRVFQQLQTHVADIPGAFVEHNKFCVSVHFRNCHPSAWQQVAEAVEEVTAQQQELHTTRGRKVLEIRPKVDWDKGCALTHLLGALGLGEGQGVLSLYVGDDRTDEDAFKALKGRPHGFGILVSCKAKATEAAYTLQDTGEVMHFLNKMVSWGKSADNAWVHAQGCTGWTFNPLPTEEAAGSSFTPLHGDDLAEASSGTKWCAKPTGSDTEAAPAAGQEDDRVRDAQNGAQPNAAECRSDLTGGGCTTDTAGQSRQPGSAPLYTSHGQEGRSGNDEQAQDVHKDRLVPASPFTGLLTPTGQPPTSD